VKVIRPEGTDPIAMRAGPPRVGTIMVRFIGILALVIALLVLIWSR